jgi:predicted transcriptional regulator
MTMTELVDRARLRRSLPDPVERRRIRRLAGVSQAEIANAIGVTQRTIARWELGEVNPRGEHLAPYIELLEQLRSVS